MFRSLNGANRRRGRAELLPRKWPNSGAFAILDRLATSYDDGDLLYRQIIDEGPDPLLIIDDQGRVMGANHAAHEFLGYGPRELVGRSIDSLIRVDGASPVVLRPGGDSEPLKSRLAIALSRNGDEAPVRSCFSTIRTDSKPLLVCAIRRKE